MSGYAKIINNYTISGIIVLSDFYNVFPITIGTRA
jgi:hypothetical protein